MKGLKGSKIFEILGRKKIIIALIILIVILSIITATFIVKAVTENKQESITYTENSKVDYRVFLRENEFFEEEYLEKDKQYIASIIKNVESVFEYKLSSSRFNENYNYSYKIVAETEVIDKTNQNSIYTLKEDLVPEKRLSVKNYANLLINENIVIDYHKYNQMIFNFINAYNLDDITPTLTISMYVQVDDITSSMSTPVASLVIPLTTKTIAIDMEANSVNATDISVYKEIANKNHLYIAVLTFILTLMIIIELYIFVNDTKDEVTIYKMKIKKILLNYDSYIQKIDNVFDYEGYQQIEMQTFEDLLQIRDTISEPILMIEGERQTEFLIPSKGKVIYIYKLKVEEPDNKDTKKSKK